MEKQNRAARQKRKKDEMARLRTLVDTAYTLDRRIKKFKEAEKAEKEARKKAKVEAARLEAMERERVEQLRLAEEKRQREKEEEAARAQVRC
jgi:DnaJ family protein C protein 2